MFGRVIQDHVNAVTEADVELLRAVAAQYLTIGAVPIAAECLDRASEIVALTDQTAAERLKLGRDRLLAGCTFSFVASERVPALSDGEERVARRCADGLSDREIAKDLGLAVRTVSNHLGRIYSRLGLDGRRNLTALWAEYSPVTSPWP